MSAGQDLATLVVEEGGVPSDRLDDALQRQVLSGGGLDTVLLEMGLIDEPTLLRLLARSEALPAVGKDAIDAADRAAVAMFPRRLAEKHGIVPLSLEGRTLSVAVSRAPDMALLDEIGFMLSVYVRPYVTAEPRIAYALYRLFEVPLPPRVRNLLGLLGEDVDGLEPLAAVVAKAAPVEPASSEGTGWSVTSARLAVTEASPLVAEGRGTGASAAAALLGGAGASSSLVDEPGPPRPSADEGRQRLLARMEAEDAAETAREHARRTERVSWTVDDAIAELALTDDRDEMLDVVLRFAYRRLSTVAIFVLQRAAIGSEAPGFLLWDLLHPTLGRRDVKDLVVAVEGGSVLARLHESKSPLLGPMAEDDPLTAAFGARPRAAVLVPILVGDVLAGALYGDNGAKAVPPSSLAELHMVVPRLGKALRNLILRRKKAAAADDAAEAARSVAVEPRAADAAVPIIEVDLDDLDDSLDGDAVDDDLEQAIAAMSAASAGSFEPAAARTPTPAPVPAPKKATGPTPTAFTTTSPAAIATTSTAATTTASRPQRTPVATGSAVPPPLPKKRPFPPVELPLEDVTVRPRSDGTSSETLSQPSSTTALAPAPVKSPGANARESLLLATWREWIRCEDNDTDELIGGLQQPGDAGRMVASAIVAKGNDAMPSLARYFPGVLKVHPFGPMETRPDVTDFSDATTCLLRLGADRAAPILVSELGHEDRLHRYTAVWCLSELHVPAALPRLAQRAFDPELRIALLALEVLDGYRGVPGFPKVVEWLREFLRRGDVFQRKRAILAAAEVSDREALDLLVNLLGTRPKEVAEEARQALLEITLQDFGFGERRWRAWIADNLRQPRTRWLLDGLSHKDVDIRERAQQELNRLTGENFGYRADASRKDREAAVKVWTAWWSEQPPDRWP